MRQRVVMVLSSLLDPSLLIADEVTSALDVSTQRAVSELLVEFRDRGFVKSMIVITHDLSVLYQIADTILVMYAGKLAEKAPAETIIDAPVHPYTQLLLVAPGGRDPLRGEAPERHSGPSTVPPRASEWLSLSDAVPSRGSSAATSRRSSTSPGSRGCVLEGGVMLTLDTCCKTYRVGSFGGGELQAVRNVSFDVGAGEVVSLIGESGSGKSTIGKMILRLLGSRAEPFASTVRTSRRSAARARRTTATCRVSSRIRSALYNPIFKADRVFTLLRGEHFSGLSGSEWSTKLRARSRT